MNLFTDSQDPERGPAWFFEMPYSKIVVVPQDALSVSSAKRDAWSQAWAGNFLQKGVAQPGEMPWFCYWNGTLLETFIYVNQTSSAGYQTTATNSPTGTAQSTQGASSTNPPSVPTSSSAPLSSYGNPAFLAAYPKVIKVEERRIPSGPHTVPPYCVQQVINGDGTATPALNSTNQPITIYLNETEPLSVSPITDKRSMFDTIENRDWHIRERQAPTSCGCVWLAT